MFCIPQEFIEPIKRAIARGEINPEKLVLMESAPRRALFEKIMGTEQAKLVNQLFEKKLLLKNQERAMYEWGRDITGLSKEDRLALQEKIRQTYADKNRRLYEPAENEVFLNEITSDAYSKKYKTEVSLEEAQKITELSAETTEARRVLDSKMPNGKYVNLADKNTYGIDYGSKKVVLEKYVGELKQEALKRGLVNPLKAKGIYQKARIAWGDIWTAFDFVASNSRSVIASVDNSFWGRQGLPGLLNPRTTKIWIKDFAKSWSDIARTLAGGNKAGDAVLDGVKAEIYSRENFLNGRYDLGRKLDIGTGEEMYPSSLPSKIPVLGRIFKGSEVAYESGAMRMRADIADMYYKMAEKVGVDLTNKLETGSINELVNSMTGRGRLPIGSEAQMMANKAFFSVKFFKGNVDFLTAHAFSPMSSFARTQAVINLGSVISTTAIILKTAQALDPDHNADIFNTTSSNFGKIRFGKVMTLDITGGKSGIIVTVSKILQQATTSPTTGIRTKLGEGYGASTGEDIFFTFIGNKFSPMFSVVRDLVRGKDFQNNKPTFWGETKRLTVPISINNIEQFKGDTGYALLIGIMADGLGLNTNANWNTTNWIDNPTKETEAFRVQIGDDEFRKANERYNKMVSEKIYKILENDNYKILNDEDKQKAISDLKSEAKGEIFSQYNFKYVKPKTTTTKPKINIMALPKK